MSGLVKVKVGTRLEPGLQRRLRVYAALAGRKLEDVVAEALDGYLPPAGVTDTPGPSASLGNCLPPLTEVTGAADGSASQAARLPGGRP